MEYIEVDFKIQPKQPATDILITSLCDIGFDSFVETEHGTCAYIPENLFSEEQLRKNDLFNNPEFKISYTCRNIASQNWNSEWEKNFDPVQINDQCLIRAPLHESVQGIRYEIIIEPKMSFGTGHHETTSLMADKMLSTCIDNIKNKDVLDMGCGTGVLAILASKIGAKSVTAIDNDQWAYTNTCENIQVNNCPEIQTFLGDAEMLKARSFDIILANINKNILLQDLPAYYQSLKTGGNILMSGFFTTDTPELKKRAESLGFKFCKETTKNNWSILHFTVI